MNIQSEKLLLIEWISKMEDSDIVKVLTQIKEVYTEDQNQDTELSPEEVEGIKRGLSDIKAGRVHDHESVKRIYEKYI